MRLEGLTIPALSLQDNLRNVGKSRGLEVSPAVVDLASDVVEYWFDELTEWAFEQHDETGEGSWWDAYTLLSAIRKKAFAS